jgi:hypothetical protein
MDDLRLTHALQIELSLHRASDLGISSKDTPKTGKKNTEACPGNLSITKNGLITIPSHRPAKLRAV